MNARLHATLMAVAGNKALSAGLEHVAKAPLASAAALSPGGTLSA